MRILKLEIYLGNKEPDSTDDDLARIIGFTLSKFVASILSDGEIEVEGYAPDCGCEVIKTRLIENGVHHVCLGGVEPEQRAN